MLADLSELHKLTNSTKKAAQINYKNSPTLDGKLKILIIFFNLLIFSNYDIDLNHDFNAYFMHLNYSEVQ